MSVTAYPWRNTDDSPGLSFPVFFPESSSSTLLMTLLLFLSCWHWAPLITSGHLTLLMLPWNCTSTGAPRSGLCAWPTEERWDPVTGVSYKSWACGSTMQQKRALAVHNICDSVSLPCRSKWWKAVKLVSAHSKNFWKFFHGTHSLQRSTVACAAKWAGVGKLTHN